MVKGNMGKRLHKTLSWIDHIHTFSWIIGTIGGSGIIAGIVYSIIYSVPSLIWVIFCVSLLLLNVPFLVYKWMRAPLEIIFDSQNTGRQFWSPKTKSDASEITSIEYRVKVRNRTNKTIYEVKATTENIGPIGGMPERLIFDQTGEPTFTLDPWASAFVKLFFATSPIRQPGILSGKSSCSYGPIKVTVSALDTKAVEKTFQLNPFEEPMISIKKWWEVNK
jgi:hypothetical protein